MKSFHFDIGNSTTGSIGFCARVIAETKEDAVKQLRKALPREINVNAIDGDGIEYIRVYVNLDAVTVKAIDDSEDVEEFDDWFDCGEGPWTSEEEARQFANAEIGLLWRVVHTNIGWHVECRSDHVYDDECRSYGCSNR